VPRVGVGRTVEGGTRAGLGGRQRRRVAERLRPGLGRHEGAGTDGEHAEHHEGHEADEEAPAGPAVVVTSVDEPVGHLVRRIVVGAEVQRTRPALGNGSREPGVGADPDPGLAIDQQCQDIVARQSVAAGVVHQRRAVRIHLEHALSRAADPDVAAWFARQGLHIEHLWRDRARPGFDRFACVVVAPQTVRASEQHVAAGQRQQRIDAYLRRDRDILEAL
jgi:hypothetical protein